MRAKPLSTRHIAGIDSCPAGPTAGPCRSSGLATLVSVGTGAADRSSQRATPHAAWRSHCTAPCDSLLPSPRNPPSLPCGRTLANTKSDAVADAGDVRLEEARPAQGADVERVEREAQAKQSNARSKMAGGEQARHRSAPGALVPVGLGATALALATALDSATPPFGFAPQQPSYTQAPSPRHLPRTAMHLLCSCHALTMH